MNQVVFYLQLHQKLSHIIAYNVCRRTAVWVCYRIALNQLTTHISSGCWIWRQPLCIFALRSIRCNMKHLKLFRWLRDHNELYSGHSKNVARNSCARSVRDSRWRLLLIFHASLLHRTQPREAGAPQPRHMSPCAQDGRRTRSERSRSVISR